MSLFLFCVSLFVLSCIKFAFSLFVSVTESILFLSLRTAGLLLAIVRHGFLFSPKSIVVVRDVETVCLHNLRHWSCLFAIRIFKPCIIRLSWELLFRGIAILASKSCFCLILGQFLLSTIHSWSWGRRDGGEEQSDTGGRVKGRDGGEEQSRGREGGEKGEWGGEGEEKGGKGNSGEWQSNFLCCFLLLLLLVLLYWLSLFLFSILKSASSVPPSLSSDKFLLCFPFHSYSDNLLSYVVFLTWVGGRRDWGSFLPCSHSPFPFTFSHSSFSFLVFCFYSSIYHLSSKAKKERGEVFREREEKLYWSCLYYGVVYSQY